MEDTAGPRKPLQRGRSSAGRRGVRAHGCAAAAAWTAQQQARGRCMEPLSIHILRKKKAPSEQAADARPCRLQSLRHAGQHGSSETDQNRTRVCLHTASSRPMSERPTLGRGSCSCCSTLVCTAAAPERRNRTPVCLHTASSGPMSERPTLGLGSCGRCSTLVSTAAAPERRNLTPVCLHTP